MAGALKAISNATLGFLGLNTQEAGVTLDSGYATRAINCIIDKSGRLGSRRGWTQLTTTPGDLGTAYIESLFEFLDEDRISTILSAGNGKIFKGTTTLTTLPVNGAETGGTSSPLSPQPTFTGNRWQFAQLAKGAGIDAEMYGFLVQGGNPALVYRRENNVGDFKIQKLEDYGNIPTGVTTFDPDCVLSAFGRIWMSGVTGAKSTIYFSRLLEGARFTGTGSGFIDIAAVVGNNDEVVALASHNGFLIVFCRNNIVIYANPDDPTSVSFALQDVITGVGCVSRDTVQPTGTDLIFLSKSGVRSFNRVITEKSLPMRELSVNIRDDLINYINGEVSENIKSVYYERDGFYLLLLPGLKQIIYFDLRQTLQNGGARTTIWTDMEPRALLSFSNNLYLGEAGGIGNYFGYSDNGASYRMEYFTQNTDIDVPFMLKFLKKAKVIVLAAGSQDIVIKYGFDYSTTFSSRTLTNTFIGGTSEYNIAEYNIGEFTPGIAISELNLNLGGSGKVLQFGVEIPIEGAPVAIQQLTVYLKLGKMN
jgi:hypothetical protein